MVLGGVDTGLDGDVVMIPPPKKERVEAFEAISSVAGGMPVEAGKRKSSVIIVWGSLPTSPTR